MRCPTCGSPIGEPVGLDEIDGCDARAIQGAGVVAWCLVSAALLVIAAVIWAVLR